MKSNDKVDVKFTLKTPREPKDGYRFKGRTHTEESLQKMRKPQSEEAKRKMSDARERQFIENNSLESDQVYMRFLDKKGHTRHFVASELQVSKDGEQWFELIEVTG